MLSLPQPEERQKGYTPPQFPYFAYEITSKTVIEVTAHKNECIAHVADGTKAWRKDLVRPDWLIDAECQGADIADLADTQECALW